MNDAERESLAQQQAHLAAALQGMVRPPAGFDPVQLDLAAKMLVRKRAHVAAKAAPALARTLGTVFEPRFFEYSVKHPLKGDGGMSDAHGFAQWLACRRDLTDSVMCAAQELLMAPRRWARAFRMHSMRRWWLLIRLPGGKIVRLWFRYLA